MWNWEQVFDRADRAEGATDAQLAKLNDDVRRPLDQAEVALVIEQHPDGFEPLDAANWILPPRPLPESYLALLRWSNGGAFSCGDRHLSDLLESRLVRETMLDYELPEYLMGCVPIALDGKGGLYLLDMRSAAVDGEYPVLFCHATNLFFEEAGLLGASLFAALSDPRDPSQL